MKFDEVLEKLDEINKDLTREDIGFDESLKLYEKAEELIKEGHKILKEGKGKIVKITESLEEIDFDDV